jgi:anti-anti-sigma factor
MLDWRMIWATAFSKDIEQVGLSMTTSALFEVEVLQPTLIVVPQENVNSLIDDRVQPELMRLFTMLENPAIRNVVIDFGQIEYFGSSMLEAMLKLWKHASSLGGKMAVCNISDIGREVLQIGHFDTLWDVCESREEALQTVQAG